MFADAMAKDQADAIEAKSKIVSCLFLCEKIKLVDDSCLVVLCGALLPPNVDLASGAERTHEIFRIITSTTHII